MSARDQTNPATGSTPHAQPAARNEKQSTVADGALPADETNAPVVSSGPVDAAQAVAKARSDLLAAAGRAKARLAEAKRKAAEAAAAETNQTTDETVRHTDGGETITDPNSTPSGKETNNLSLDVPEQYRNKPVQERRRSKFGLNSFLFLLIVIIPVFGTAFYYYAVAQDQYMSVSRFAVRGVEGAGVDGLNLSMLPGATTEATDAYIVNEYIRSVQMFSDLRNNLDFDIRSYYAKSEIDPLYRIDADMPSEKFVDYWAWMSESEFNSTTKITTFQVRAFSPEDAKVIADTVIAAASELINRLSDNARRKIVRTAREEVERTEKRLRTTRRDLTNFRNREQSLDPSQLANQKENLASGLEKQLVELRLRRTSLLSTINSESPTVRVLDRQIAALEDELERQRRIVGTGTSEAPDTEGANANLSVVYADYSELQLEEEFAESAYKAALSSLESAQADARKQERYFAIVVSPTKPAVSLYPERWIIVLSVFGLGILVWFLAYLIVQSIRDHAV